MGDVAGEVIAGEVVAGEVDTAEVVAEEVVAACVMCAIPVCAIPVSARFDIPWSASRSNVEPRDVSPPRACRRTRLAGDCDR